MKFHEEVEIIRKKLDCQVLSPKNLSNFLPQPKCNEKRIIVSAVTAQKMIFLRLAFQYKRLQAVENC